MNYLDIGILVLVALCALAGYQQGIIRTVYRLISFFLAIFFATLLHPYVSQFLRDSVFFVRIQDGIKSTLNLDGFVTTYAEGMHTEIIDSLPLPGQIRGMLHSQFEPNIHGILRVDTIEEYVSAFFANIAINGISIIAVFCIVLIGLSLLGVALDVVGKLPVISTFNNWGGLIFGVIMGAGISYICIYVLSMFFATSANPEVYEMINGSFIARNVLELMLPRLTAV